MRRLRRALVALLTFAAIGLVLLGAWLSGETA